MYLPGSRTFSPSAESFPLPDTVSNAFVDSVSVASPLEAEATSIVDDVVPVSVDVFVVVVVDVVSVVVAVLELVVFVSPHPASETPENSIVAAVKSTASREEIWFQKLNLKPNLKVQ